MIKYPLNVTIDSNIFDSTKYDFSEDSTLSLLASYVEQEKIKIFLSDIVYREVKNHIEKKAQEIASKARSLRTEVLSNVSEDLIRAVGMDYILQIPDKKQVKEKAIADWDDFLKRLKPIWLDYKGIRIESILDDYFAVNAPFENSEKKRKEFPDAFIAAQIREKFQGNAVVAIITDDKGFKTACGNTGNYLYFNKLADLFATLSKQDEEYANAVSIIKNLAHQINEQVRDGIYDLGRVEVFGVSVDKDGITSGHEYEDIEILALSPVSSTLHYLDDVSDNSITATLVCHVDIDVNCYFNDYENSPWDPETKDYLYLVERTFFERHSANFGMRVEIDRKTLKYRLSNYKVFLGVDSLKERYEVQEESEEDWYSDIEDMDRENVGLTPFGKYQDKLEDDLPESTSYEEIIGEFELIRQCYSKAEEISGYYDELIEKIHISDDNTEKMIIAVYSEIAKKMSVSSSFPRIDTEAEMTSGEYIEITKWIEEQFSILTKLSEASLVDYFQYGDTIPITGVDGNYYFSIDDLNINPSEGEEIVIDIKLLDEEGKVLGKGYTQLLVGYLYEDEDGGIGDALEDELSYSFDEVRDAICKVREKISCYVNQQEEIGQIICDQLDL